MHFLVLEFRSNIFLGFNNLYHFNGLYIYNLFYFIIYKGIMIFQKNINKNVHPLMIVKIENQRTLFN